MEETPRAFVWRRLHSLSGAFFVLFLIEHLLTNSEAALFVGEDGHGFVRMVNFIHSLPYLPFIEIFLLGVPILIHAAWGIRYLRTSQVNSFPSSGSTVGLSGYIRNHTFTWQRATSWILLIGIVLHVYEMRFERYPLNAGTGKSERFMVHQSLDRGLYTVAKRLNVELFDEVKIKKIRQKFDERWAKDQGFFERLRKGQASNILLSGPQSVIFDPEKSLKLEKLLAYDNRLEWLNTVESIKLNEGEVVAVSKNFGTAVLLVVRETFKSPLMIALYTIFVLSAVFHAFNGLWTFLISWGFTMTPRSQALSKMFTSVLMLVMAFLGLASIWGTYWLNLRY